MAKIKIITLLVAIIFISSVFSASAQVGVSSSAPGYGDNNGPAAPAGYGNNNGPAFPTVYGSQCNNGENDCTNTNDSAILKDQCTTYYDASVCGSMPSYLGQMESDCDTNQSQGKAQGIDCNMISHGNYYGPAAAAYAQWMASNQASGEPSKTPDVSGEPSKTSDGVYIPTSAETGLSDKSIKDILTGILTWMLGIVGVIALIGFVISGAQYILASGNERTIETAKRNMIYSIIGVVVVLAGFVIIQAIDFALRGYSSF